MRPRSIQLAVSVFIAASLWAISAAYTYAADTASAARVTGTVSYRERIALGPNATVVVRIESTGGTLVSETRFATGGKQVPIPYSLHYLTAAMPSGSKYVIRASIVVDAKTLFVGQAPLASARPRTANLVLSRPVRVSSDLSGHWKLSSLNGKALSATNADVPSIRFEPGGKLSGNTGVNLFSGTYTTSDTRITLDPGAMTMRGGSPEMMSREKDFIQALKSATNWRMSGAELELLSGSRVVAGFRRIQR